jgi:uncharacterized protein
MSLRDRLRSMQGAAKAPAPSAPPDVAGDEPGAPTQAGHIPPPDAATAAALPPAPSTRSAHGPEALLPGTVCDTPYGCCYVAEWRYPLAHRHGHAPLGMALDAALAEAAVVLARAAEERAALARVDPRRLVYLDTETTGLAGGTGTYAFLVGIGRFTDDEFVVRQLFMRELGEEHALLHVLAGELRECDVLVTYNGKAFDWPLLETRYALARRAGPRRPRDPVAHVDLLFSARRLWRARLGSCSLGHVEHHLLGVRRADDTPGWLIPQLYFAYLRSRDARPLAGVFRHNTLDILSLARLLGHVAHTGSAAPADVAADELLALGRCPEEAGDAARALACYEAAFAGAGPLLAEHRRAVTHEARVRAGALLKRLRRFADALAHWEALAAAGPLGSPSLDIRPLEELAKHYEHVARDRVAARAYVRQALALLDVSTTPGAALAAAQRERARLLHRLRRLERAAGPDALGASLDG